MRKAISCLAAALLLLVVALPVQAQQMDEPLSRWDLVQKAGLPAAGHYTLGAVTYDGAEGLASLLLPDDAKEWANEIGLAATIIAGIAFEHDPLFSAEDKVAEALANGVVVTEAAIQLDGGMDLLERTASGIGEYIGDTLGPEFEIGFKLAAFVVDVLVTTEADRDLRQ